MHDTKFAQPHYMYLHQRCIQELDTADNQYGCTHSLPYLNKGEPIKLKPSFQAWLLWHVWALRRTVHLQPERRLVHAIVAVPSTNDQAVSTDQACP